MLSQSDLEGSYIIHAWKSHQNFYYIYQIWCNAFSFVCFMQHGLVVGNLLEFFCCFVRMAGLLVHCFKLPLCVSRSLLMHKCGRPGSIAVFRNLTMKSFFKKKKQSESMSTASTAIDNTKTDYEKELERFIKQEKVLHDVIFTIPGCCCIKFVIINIYLIAIWNIYKYNIC